MELRKSKGKCKRRFPSGMTKREWIGAEEKQRQVQMQIPCGNDKREEGMTAN